MSLNAKDTRKPKKVARKLKNSASQKGFEWAENLNNLKEIFNVNFVLLYVSLDHKKVKYFSLSRKYQRCVICGGNQCRVGSYQWKKYQLLLVLQIVMAIWISIWQVRSYICTCQTLIVKHKVKQSTNKKQTRKWFV